MPKTSGVELAEQLLQIRPDVTVVLVTGYLHPEELDRARAIGIREILLKPVAIEEFGPVVRRLLDASHPPDDMLESRGDRHAGV